MVDFPSPRQLLQPVPARATVSAVLEAINRADTTFRIDDPGEAIDSAAQVAVKPAPAVKLSTGLQYRDERAMQKFYRALHALKREPATVRVLHYGDSQIEGDRITDYLRSKLQAQFGGAGPGLISLMPLTSSPGIRVINGPDWERYTLFTSKDKRVPHNRYGPRAGFARFVPYDGFDSLSVYSSSIQIVCNEKVSETMRGVTRLRLFYGGSRARTWCEYYDGPALVAADSLRQGGSFNVREYPVMSGPTVREFRFAGSDSPDFYAFSLEGEEGVMVDNIAMRGSSGTFYHHVDKAQMKRFYDYLNVKLVILQFGGNTVPSIRDTAMARNYASYMRNQVAILRKLAPEASILFIGPADMSVKDGTRYVTHPFVESVRDNLREVMLDAGCAFFDVFDAMGGRNSMPVWVDERLAGRDYIHFSPKGARKIGTLLYSALINDYNSYLRELP